MVISIDLFYMNGLVLTLILSLIMLGVYTLIHLFSYILQDESLRAKAKHEYGQVIFNVFIFIFIIMAVHIVDDEIMAPGVKAFDPYASVHTTPNKILLDPLTYNLTMQDAGIALDVNDECLYTKKGWNATYPAHTCVAISFLDRASWLCEESMGEMLKIHNSVGVMASTKIMVTALIVLPKLPFILTIPSAAQPFNGLSVELGVIQRCFDIISKSIISIRAQLFAFDMIAQVLFPVFLIGGIVMRSFIFTRKFGGFLIAAALSLYYIAPLVYIIGHRAMFESGNFIGIDYSTTALGTKEYKMVPYADLMRGSGFRLTPSLPDLDADDWTDPIGTIGKIAGAGKEYYNEILSGGDAYLSSHIQGKGIVIDPQGLAHMTAKIMMISIVMPLLTLLAILASIKAIAPFFGGDASIAGLTHFL